MRLMMYLAMTDPSLSYPIDPLAVTLDFPSSSDRNKAASTLRMAAEFEGHREVIIATALPERPNFPDPAYETLRIVSGRDYPERHYAAWATLAAEQTAAISRADR